MAHGRLQSIGAGSLGSRSSEAAIGWTRILVGAVELLAVPLVTSATAERRVVAAATLFVAWVASELLRGRAKPFGALAFDVSAVFALHVVAGDVPVELLYLPVVLLHAYSGGPLRGRLAAAGAIAAMAVAREVNPEAGPASLTDLLALAGAVIVLAALLELLGRQQRAVVRELGVQKSKAEAVVDRSGDAIVVTDTAGRVRQWNAAAERLSGLAPTAAVGKRCAAVLGLHAGERELDCSNGCALLAGGDAVHDVEVWRMRADGRRQPLLASVAAVGEGADRQVIHSARDITKLKEADEAKSLFLATASHELKTPLTVIRGFANLLSVGDEVQDDQAREHLALIERRAVELGKVVERLLLSSRIEAGRNDIRRQLVDVGEVVAERVSAMRDATERDIRLRGGSVPAVWGDGDAVATVVDHLLDNAVKYSPEGGVISVVVRTEPDVVTFSVSDEGVGMDADQQEHCFDRFWQAESTDVRRFGGTGIGLFIVKALVEAMGGDVRVTSRLGEGTTFDVSLRRVDRAEDVGGEADPAPGVGESTIIREFMRQIGVPTT